MSQDVVSAAVTSALQEALTEAKTSGELRLDPWPAIALDTPKRESWGDLATTVAMALAQGERRPPQEIADVIASYLQRRTDVFDRVVVAAPGYINLTIRRDQWFRVLSEIEEKRASYGTSNIGNGQTVLIEFVSANPTGPLHVGHGRGAAVGDALARLLRCAGYEVRTEYYVNDLGTQIETLGKSVAMRYRQLSSSQDALDSPLPEGCYQGTYISDIARGFAESRLVEHTRDEDPSIPVISDYATDRLLRETFDDLRRFGVVFDDIVHERDLHTDGIVEQTLDGLRGNGYTFDHEGAEWLATSRLGDQKDRVIKRANGQYTYFASDIAYHRRKLDRGVHRLVNVWGADHHGYIPRMKAAIRALGYPEEIFHVVLVQLVSLLRGDTPVAMSTRAGEFVTLKEVIDEVGVDAARFFFLMRRSDTPLDFDLDLAKHQSSDNPVYYVQYAHARLASLLKIGREQGIPKPSVSDVDLALLALPEELAMIKKLAHYPALIEESAKTLEPHRVSFYLQELAGLLHAYYYKHRILQAGTPGLVKARLVLMGAVKVVLKNGLDMLGVSAPDSM